MEIKKVLISSVKTWEKNPRNIKTEDYERLKRQIKKLGVYKPLVCFMEKGKYITLGGNMRLMALKDLGQKEVEVSIVKPKTEAEKVEYSLSDNDRAGEYDELALAELVYNVKDDIELADFKVDLGTPLDIWSLLDDYGPDGEGVEDEIPEIDDSPAITKQGDLFLLGEHRLLCGDATKEGDVKRLMNGEKADMVFTDPPYGMDLDTDFRWMKGFAPAHKYEKVEGDAKEYNPSHIFEFFKCKEIFLWGADYYMHNIPKRNAQNDSIFVWDKRIEERMDRAYGSGFEICWSKNKHKREIVRFRWLGAMGTETQDIHGRIHPTQKPIQVREWFVSRFSKDTHVIVDPYIGSGTTLIACEKLNRKCYGMEISEKYCDVIIKRFSDYAEMPEESIRETVQRKKQQKQPKGL